MHEKRLTQQDFHTTSHQELGRLSLWLEFITLSLRWTNIWFSVLEYRVGLVVDALAVWVFESLAVLHASRSWIAKANSEFTVLSFAIVFDVLCDDGTLAWMNIVSAHA